MFEARFNIFRDPRLRSILQGQYSQKLKTNQSAGGVSFKEGNYRAFNGYDSGNGRRIFNFTLVYDAPSQSRLRRRVIDPLHDLARKYNIPWAFTLKGDIPAHTTLEAATFYGLNDEQIDKLQQTVSSPYFHHLDRIANLLVGRQFRLDTLVVAPNIYICAGNFDRAQEVAFRTRVAILRALRLSLREITDWRSLTPEGRKAYLAETAEKFREPYSYGDIFSISIGRLVEVGTPAEKLLAFANEAFQMVGRELKRNPVSVKVGHVFRGPAVNFQRYHAPHLLDRAIPIPRS